MIFPVILEVIVKNISEPRVGKRLEKLPGMLELLEQMVVRFLGVVQAADLSFLDGERLDQLALPSGGGNKRLAGVDLNKAGMRAVGEAVLAPGAAPRGFSARDLAEKVHDQVGRTMSGCNPRQAAYDLRKLRGKS